MTHSMVCDASELIYIKKGNMGKKKKGTENVKSEPFTRLIFAKDTSI